MPRPFVDVTGQKYGRLTALKCLGRQNKRTYWLFKCECGKEHKARLDAVKQGKIKSCGCATSELVGKAVRKRNLLPPGESAFTFLYHDLKNSARARGIPWHLTKEQVRKLVTAPCYYCGIEFSREYYRKGTNGAFRCNGIDRVDSTKGYVLENCVPCCKRCNLAKHDMTIDEFKIWLKMVSKHFLGTGEEQNNEPQGN